MSLGFIWLDLKMQWQYVGLVVLAALLLTVYFYRGYHFFFKKLYRKKYGDHPYFEWMAHAYQFAVAWGLLVIVPVIYIKLALHRPLADFGVTWGRWGVGLVYVIIFAAILTPNLKRSAAHKPLYREYPLVRDLYGLSAKHKIAWELTYLMYYIPFEFFFRGFIQMGMQPSVGITLAMCFQLLPSVLIHLNKPEEETLAAVGGAFLMGLAVALTGSLVWPILLHWFVGAMTDYYCFENWQKEKERLSDGRGPVMVP